jgi:hypothetical protein
MGLNKGESAGMIYLSVANGKLVQQVKEQTTTSVSRINKVDKTVHEEFFKDLTGVITKIETKENEFGKQWQIVFQDGDSKYMVQMPYSGRYSSSFLKALPNITQGQPVRFMPWEMKDKNDSTKKVTGVTLYQDDGNGFVKIPSAFTKEDPNGLPQMKKVKVKGKETWDDSEMMEFLEDMAKRWLLLTPKAKEPEDKLPFDEPEAAPF